MHQKGTGVNTLTPKQIFQILTIPFAKVKVDNKSESLLNEIREIVYLLYQSNQVTKLLNQYKYKKLILYLYYSWYLAWQLK